jgi:MYND finger
MVKAKKGKKKSAATAAASVAATATTTAAAATMAANAAAGAGAAASGSFTLNRDGAGNVTSITNNRRENLDDLQWLRECELRHTATGEPYLQLEYQDDDELIVMLQRFLEESAATTEIIDAIYQIWQQTVLSTLLQSSAVWKKDRVTAADQRQMKDTLKTARYKINFLLHHVTGSILTNSQPKWKNLRESVLGMCYNTLQLVPRLAESCPHSPIDIRLAIIHFEGKEFLAAVACETWDTLYDFSVPIDHNKFIPILRRCAMLDILDKDWNMLGGWEDILKGIEAKCCPRYTVSRLPADAVLHEATTVLRNARNSMQCKFFSVRFMRYTEDQAPQRWRYFSKCSAPACANIETADHPHPHRCKKCWYFHYCSSSCQEYCDNILGLHPKFCKDTPASKASLCQKETEQYLGWTSPCNDSVSENNINTNADGDAAEQADKGAENRIRCHACGILEDPPPTTNGANGSKPSSSMKRCIQCHSVSYCSRQCQEWDWRVGGHRDACCNGEEEEDNNDATATTTATADTAGTSKSSTTATVAGGGGGGEALNVKELN